MSLINMKLFKDDKQYYDLKNIESKVKNNENNKVLEFIIDNIVNTYIIDESGCIFIRENNEFKFILDTIKKEATYLLKEIDTTFDIKVEKCDLIKNDNRLTIKYQLETDDNLNIIEITKGEML